MVSFGLAFGKGVVTGLGKQQERKWAKEAYEESPEFELAGLQIKQAKENWPASENCHIFLPVSPGAT